MDDSRHDASGILALVPDDWSVAWQRRHHVLTRLAEQVPVAWISPPLDWRRWLERRRDANRTRARLDENMFVLASADGPPLVRAPSALRGAILRGRARRGAEWLHAQGCARVELQLWKPEFAEAIDWGLHASSSYHIDDEYSWSTVDQPLSATERRLIARVDRVYVSSPKLLETKGGINPRTTFSPNGVDYRAFSTPTHEPSDLRDIPHPRVAYVGVLKEQLDWELLIELATRNPAWSFVFVGPVRSVHTTVAPAIASLRRLPNVHLVSERRVAELPAILQHVDVAVLPYVRNDYTDAINPMKLYEALAAGTPVVASRLRTVESFASVVSIADGVNDWSARIGQAISPEAHSEERVAERRVVAKGYDWEKIAEGLLR